MIGFKKLALGSVLLIILILGVVYSFNEHLVGLDDQRFKVGTTYMTMNNRFYQALHAEIEKKVNAEDGVLYTRDPALDIDKQIEQINSFIAKGVDVIILNPVDSRDQGLIEVVQKAKHQGIAIIVVDSELKDSSMVDSTIVSDNYQAGVLAAEDMMATKESARILLLEHSDTQSGTQRIQGFVDTISGHDSYQVVARRESLGQTEVAMPQVEELLSGGLNFDVIMALNDQAAIGALAALKKHQVTSPVLIYGVDGSPDMKQILASSSDVQGTVAQSPIAMGQKAVEIANKLHQGQIVDKHITIPVQLLTKSMADQIDKNGWQ
ncbi:substrate-binding domain-containing protein [Streptococcus caprae]|uniref:Sugar ABC transporter substrate-binding protein n=1 Tax=Streptococcus caprae TaxID=1640501 RepID=A0ABV8CTG6_9STRE